MVGCHQGVVEECYFHGEAGFEKLGGYSDERWRPVDILVQCCFFDRAGGSWAEPRRLHGLAVPYFRPSVSDYEATRLLVAGNRFGLGMRVPWLGQPRTTTASSNTVVLPDKWIGRILQETRDPRFKSSHDGTFEKTRGRLRPARRPAGVHQRGPRYGTGDLEVHRQCLVRHGGKPQTQPTRYRNG